MPVLGQLRSEHDQGLVDYGAPPAKPVSKSFLDAVLGEGRLILFPPPSLRHLPNTEPDLALPQRWEELGFLALSGLLYRLV